MSELDEETRWENAARLLDDAGEALLEGSLARARELASEAAVELQAIVGEEHPDFASALHVLGEVAMAAGQAGEAVERFEAALAIFNAHLAEHPQIVGPMRLATLQLLARTRSDTGRHTEAEALLREAIVEAQRHGDALVEAGCMQALGVALRFAARYDDALQAYERSAELRLAAGESLGPDHFHNLAGLALARGDAPQSEAHARQAITLREQDDFGLAMDLCGLADALAVQLRCDEAEPLYRRALAIYASGERSEHPEVAFALHNLGDALVVLEKFDEAESSYRASLARKLAAFGPGTPDEAGTRNNLAVLLAERGQIEEAWVESSLACELVRARLPVDHPIRVACEAVTERLAITRR